MLSISNELQKTLRGSLELYYKSISEGDLSTLCTLMTRESYLLTLGAFGTKEAFKDETFKHLLQEMENDAVALSKVEKILSHNLREEARKYVIEVISYELKGLDRVTLHYTQNEHPKKIYFSKQLGKWKIDFKAGRKKES